MNPSHKPPNFLSDDSHSDGGYVPSKLVKGKRKAEGKPRAVSSPTTSAFLMHTLSSKRLLFRLGHGLHAFSSIDIY